MRLILSLLLALPLWAAPQTNAEPGGAALRLAVQFTLAALVPMFFVTLTPFLRISVVLHFLRQALGTQTVPSNQVVIALSSLLTILAISPQVTAIYKDVIQPYNAGKMAEEQAFTAGGAQMKTYMLPYLGEKEIALMLRVSHAPAPKSPSELGFPVIAGAYMLSELKSAFKIGVLLYMPFLIIDLIVSAVIVTLGMIQLPPVMISAPFKILIFVVSDGWTVIIDALMKSLQVAR
ncbi:flagellar type III secretion system pore protein FliP [Bryobacter aggregatus]|uniref:flagellar type III secretion system pore protein FliP n=1 Tax=Bryobacter aggregatus TaxID=360054 RepID=UPI00068F66C8|nr:flagellar type III secretion system pore protein FliP [Bryobacter aggregatus]